jgi:hypothetical protein
LLRRHLTDVSKVINAKNSKYWFALLAQKTKYLEDVSFAMQKIIFLK